MIPELGKERERQADVCCSLASQPSRRSQFQAAREWSQNKDGKRRRRRRNTQPGVLLTCKAAENKLRPSESPWEGLNPLSRRTGRLRLAGHVC